MDKDERCKQCDRLFALLQSTRVARTALAETNSTLYTQWLEAQRRMFGSEMAAQQAVQCAQSAEGIVRDISARMQGASHIVRRYLCVGCRVAPADTLLVDCGHLVCGPCAQRYGPVTVLTEGPTNKKRKCEDSAAVTQEPKVPLNGSSALCVKPGCGARITSVRRIMLDSADM